MNPQNRRRPSKTHSLVGLILGILFIGFGVFFIIPRYGALGFLWTFLALFIIIVNSRNVFGKSVSPAKRPKSEEQHITYEDQNSEERLSDLYMLYNRKLITEEQYQHEREEILRSNSVPHNEK